MIAFLDRFIEIGGLIVSVLSLYALYIARETYVQNKINIERNNQKEEDNKMLEQCILSLSRAYEMLGPDPVTNLAYRDRLRWLSVARMIMRYYGLRDKIKDQVYKNICAEHEEYWRSRFYELLDSDEYNVNYYSENADKSDENNITCRSALVIHDFCRWKNVDDILNGFSLAEAIKKNEMYLLNSGLGDYLRLYNHTRQLIEDNEDASFVSYGEEITTH